MWQQFRCPPVFALLVCLVLGSACAFDSSGTDPEDRDVLDPGDIDISAPDTVTPGVSACGGSLPLEYAGRPAQPGQTCGPFREGTLACAGVDALRCVGESLPNACGGRGVLPVGLGDPCGVCGDGAWTCGEGGSVACVGATPPNACGGCAALTGRPGGRCDADSEAGRWVCTTPDTLTCVAGTGNTCGGTSALRHDGRAAQPGDVCSTACGSEDGVLRCDGSEALRCSETDRTPPSNGCGGCDALPGREGSRCGGCDDGTWTCTSPETMRCLGGSTVSACGGCGGGDQVLGSTCDVDRVWVCDGTELLCAFPVDEADRNACGGTVPLAQAPGEPCGPCGRGRFTCASRDRVTCEGDRPGNACGGCAAVPGEPGAPCGTCGSGAWTCRGDSLQCEGDRGEGARNVCGGCGEIAVSIGSACGQCLAWVCTGAGGVACRVTSEGEGCGDLVTCDDLDCAVIHRRCEESDGSDDASCTDCLPGYEEEGDVCRPEAETGVTCAELRCENQGRVCVEGPAEEDAVCAGCLQGRADCDGVAATGCETNTRTSVDHCGGCGVACDETGGEVCIEGACRCADGTLPGAAGCSPPPGTLPVVVMPPPGQGALSDITGEGVRVRAGLTEVGTPARTSPGFCLAEAPRTPTGDDNCLGLPQRSAPGTFEAAFSGLTPATRYRVRAYASNDRGTAWSDAVTFTTIGTPRIALGDVEARAEGVRATIVIESPGEPLATSHGLCVALQAQDLNANCRSEGGLTEAGTRGPYTRTLSVPGATYYVRAYAENDIGRVTSATVTVRAWELPEVDTLPPGDVAHDRFRARGMVTRVGVPEAVTSRGFCYSLSNTPPRDGQTGTDCVSAPAPGGDGVFSQLLQGFQPNQEVHVAAWVVSAAGRAWGPSRSFVTGPIVPQVTTMAANSVTFSQANLRGRVASAGDPAPTQARFRWRQEGGSEQTLAVSGAPSGLDPFMAPLTGLSASTTYQFRAEVRHERYGWVQGEWRSFTTDAPPPVTGVLVSPDGVDNATCGSFSGSGPCRTVAYAYNQRAAQMNQDRVVLLGSASTVFTETETILLASGRNLVGGYQLVGGSVQPTGAAPTLRSSHWNAIRGDGLTGAVRIASVVVETTDRPAGASVPSTYVLILRNSGAHVSLKDVTLRAGRARHGADGVDGTPGCDGRAGFPGGAGSSGRGGTGAEGAPTGPVTSAGCNAEGGNQAGGRGGDGVNGNNRGNNGFCAPLRTGGTGTCLGGGGGAGAGGSPCAFGDASTGGSGGNGGAGAAGSHGEGGVSGLLQAGAYTQDPYAPRAAAQGTAGLAGRGGGGGGGGGGSTQGFICTDSRASGGGGGGGAGGFGGVRGTAGGSGGASVAIVLDNSTLDLRPGGNRILTQGGGDGEAGGNGGDGGWGGVGGAGGDRESAQASNGGGGGRGGNGGHGGCGGGGSGGPSVGVWGVNAAMVLTSPDVTTSVSAGPGGVGGAACPREGAEAGTDGPSMPYRHVMVCSGPGGCFMYLDPPERVEATWGTTPDHVVVSWTEAPFAAAYHVYRDGVRITTAPVTERTFVDTRADAPPVPTIPSFVSATSSRPMDIVVSWGSAQGGPGATHAYAVLSVAADTTSESPLSEVALGRRAPYPILRYDIERNGTWIELGTEQSWTDTQAPAGTLGVGTFTASTEDTTRVQLSASGYSREDGPAVSYRVRAWNEAGVGTASSVRTGNRWPGPLRYMFQWSPNGSSGWTSLTTEPQSSSTYSDTTIDQGSSRWYRVIVTAEGATQVTSPAVRGTRPRP